MAGLKGELYFGKLIASLSKTNVMKIKNSDPMPKTPLPKKEEMKTLSAVINSLTRDGYETQFKINKYGLKSLSTEKVYRPDEIKIINFYRFEGESDPADNSIVYAIETADGELGTVTDAYGPYSDAMLTTFFHDVETIEKKPHDSDEEEE